MEFVSVTVYPDGRMDAENASRYLGFTKGTLATMRFNGTGPKFIKKGRVFYFKHDLDEWLNSGFQGRKSKALKTSIKTESSRLLKK